VKPLPIPGYGKGFAMNRVKDFQDLPELFIEETEKEKTMGATHKKTAQTLDKMVQFIWDYQDKHEGATPTLTTVANHVGVKNSASATYFMNKLVDDGRVDKISSMPFRVSITDHKDNQRAIASFQRLRAMKEQFEDGEREKIRAEQDRLKRADEREANKTELYAAHNTQVTERPTETIMAPTTTTPAPGFATRVRPENPTTEPIGRFLAARQEATLADRDIKSVMPQLIKVADTRDLMFELVTRGYVVSKR
jgi:hypothetical protein